MNRKKKISPPVKIQGNSYSFEAAESEYDNQIPLSPTSVKGERITLTLWRRIFFLILAHSVYKM